MMDPCQPQLSTSQTAQDLPSKSAIVQESDNISLAAPYLSNPSKSHEVESLPVASTSTSSIVRKDRIYIGNLHPSVDEYTLLQIFQKYGKVAHLDFLFHKTGALKGKPRGYAFLEFVEKEDALRALVELHNKPFRGRRLVVTFAHQAPIDPNAPSRLGAKRSPTDTTRPTALSLLKSNTARSQRGTEDKIAAMEAKLAQMHEEKQKQDSTSSGTLGGVAPGVILPDKPLPSLVRAAEKAAEGGGGLSLPASNSNKVIRKSAPSPSLVIQNRSGSSGARCSGKSTPLGIKSLSGVKIGPRR